MRWGFIFGLLAAWCWGQWIAANVPEAEYALLLVVIGSAFIGFTAAAYDRANTNDEEDK